jgi:hypothetical protein
VYCTTMVKVCAASNAARRSQRSKTHLEWRRKGDQRQQWYMHCPPATSEHHAGPAHRRPPWRDCDEHEPMYYCLFKSAPHTIMLAPLFPNMIVWPTASSSCLARHSNPQLHHPPLPRSALREFIRQSQTTGGDGAGSTRTRDHKSHCRELAGHRGRPASSGACVHYSTPSYTLRSPH